MKLIPFAEIIAATEEKMNELLAGPRARKVKSQAETKMADLDTELVTLEMDAQELLKTKEINFDKLFEILDNHALVQRRKEQYVDVLSQLFPVKE
jgi:signal transduction histidine kinase